MTDHITGAIVYTYEALGPGVLALGCIFIFLGVPSLTALFEHRTARYKAGGNVPFHRNVSTIIDFAFLNPVMVVVAAYTTSRMYTLPTLLQNKLALPVGEFQSLTKYLR